MTTEEQQKGTALKVAVLARCKERLGEQLQVILNSLQKLRDSKTSETKSSAGDKFETGRAMLQLEENNLRQQLAAVRANEELLDKATRQPESDAAAIGSLVATDRGLYLLAAGLGKVTERGRVVYCVSPASPIGRRLVGKRVGDKFLFNDTTFTIRGLA